MSDDRLQKHARTNGRPLQAFRPAPIAGDSRIDHLHRRLPLRMERQRIKANLISRPLDILDCVLRGDLLFTRPRRNDIEHRKGLILQNCARLRASQNRTNDQSKNHLPHSNLPIFSKAKRMALP